MGLLNYLGGRGSSGFGEGSSRHVESDVVTVGGVALAMVLLVNEHAREFGRNSILVFVWIMVAIGFLDTLADPEEGRRVLSSCGVRLTRLRSTLTALLVWFVLVTLVRALAITVFEVVTDFNAERGNPENGKV